MQAMDLGPGGADQLQGSRRRSRREAGSKSLTWSRVLSGGPSRSWLHSRTGSAGRWRTSGLGNVTHQHSDLGSAVCPGSGFFLFFKFIFQLLFIFSIISY